ncbi:hypothetical protein CDCA_CDCA02G0759 [Cyanidium caldarium]|uniref:Letm1 RBD domain-containing protein n=1 Tax=Cyanidium caldarium TaxID=2771 RepID=A0AAV9IQY8_CYACA|nr:hypothetical protein CDCA_CDCA02G0759 [Cyanidium caldarium]
MAVAQTLCRAYGVEGHAVSTLRRYVTTAAVGTMGGGGGRSSSEVVRWGGRKWPTGERTWQCGWCGKASDAWYRSRTALRACSSESRQPARTDDVDEQQLRKRRSPSPSPPTPPPFSWSMRWRQAWQRFRDAAGVYWRGTVQLVRNALAAGTLERRLRQHGPAALTYTEHLLVVHTRHDKRRALILLATGAVSTALIPVLAEAIPGFKPTTFTTDAERQYAWQMQGLRFWEAQCILLQQVLKSVDAAEPTPLPRARYPSNVVDGASTSLPDSLAAALQRLSRAELQALCRVLGQAALPFSLTRSLRRRVQRHLEDVQQLDVALRHCGVATLDATQLADACLMRGLPAYGRTTVQMSHDLQRWVDHAPLHATAPLKMVLNHGLRDGRLAGWTAPWMRRLLGNELGGE